MSHRQPGERDEGKLPHQRTISAVKLAALLTRVPLMSDVKQMRTFTDTNMLNNTNRSRASVLVDVAGLRHGCRPQARPDVRLFRRERPAFSRERDASWFW